MSILDHHMCHASNKNSEDELFMHYVIYLISNIAEV